MSIQIIRIGEIIFIDGVEYIIANTPHKNGRIEWEQPTLIKLKSILKKTPKKWRGCDKSVQPFRKFKGIKLTAGGKNGKN